MENAIESYAMNREWSKQELELLLALAVQGKGRHEIAEIMRLPLSEVVRAALKYSLALSA